MKKIILSLSLLLMMTFIGFSQSLPIDFDDVADNNFIGQGGSTFMADVSPTDGNNNVGQTVGGTDQYNSRIDLALGTYIDMTTANKTFTFDFYTTEAVVMNGLFQIGNEADGGFPIEMQFTTDGNIGWETITLDFTNATNGFPNAGDPVVYGQYAQLSIFTNFADFGTSTYYVDNIAGAANGAEVVLGPEPMVAAPTPTHDEVNDNVLSVYSGAYTDLAGTDFNPGWGQVTLSTEVMIEGNNTLKYANLNYQGTQLANPQDVSNHAFLHVDFWTADATALEFYLISVGSGEQKYDLTVSTEQWVSVDIPLSTYSGLGLDLTDIHQFKVVGDGNVWFDNWYFYTSATEPVGNTCVDFEPGGLGDSWDWVIDANDDNPALVFASNPATDGINTSATAAQFTARQAGASFALTYTSDIDAFQFNATNSTMKIMVHKTVISDFAIKLEGPSPAIEIKIPNTVVGEWEELTFDFSAQIGNTYNRLVIIPDFDEVGRTQDNVIYFDNIKMPEGNVTPPAEPMTAAPDPTHDEVDDHVLSVYSGVYTDLAGTEFNPNWGQLTDVTEVMLESNNTLKYFNLNYQGTQLAAAQDVSGHKFLHVDFWTPNAESLEFYLISVGSGEQKYDLTITAEEWVSVDIPLDDYSNLGLDLTDIHQFKVVGNGNVWFDNLYFHTENIIIPLAEPTVAAPTPIHDESSHQVISVYSGAYNNLTGTDFNPNWGQQTTVEGVVVDNDFVIKYSNLNYQGMQFANQDVSGLDFLHIDFWTPNSTDLGLYLISSTGAEHEYVFTVVTEQWVSVDIPLSHFANAESNFVAPVDLTDVFQFKTEGNGTVYLDNIYFYNSVPLATDLVSFQADAQGKIIDLTWQTASETNNSHFEVEHTTNGIDFKMIGKVEGNGSTTEVSTYGFSHQAPIGVNYYRLRQVDFNGEYKYSQIVKAERTTIDNTIVYPNPAQDLINIDYISSIDEEVKVVITDITGRIVFSQILIANTGENHFNIDISTLPQGSYYLSLESSREYSLKAIIKE